MAQMKKSSLGMRLKVPGRTLLQRLFISFQLFSTGGSANHAAAGAFGFLLSSAPVLLLVFFFLAAAFRSSPQAVYSLIKQISLLEIAFDEEWLTSEFMLNSRRGLSAIISIISIFWAGRVFAVSMQRGLKVIFSGPQKRTALTENLIVFFIEALALVFALIIILSSKVSLQFYETFSDLPKHIIEFISESRLPVFQITALWIMTYCTYRITPANVPSRRSALWGSLSTIVSYGVLAWIFRIFVNQIRYHFIYGALGSLIILLLNVYFFFMFFFFGAWLAFVIDNFDALLFIQFRKIREDKSPLSLYGKLMKKLFCSIGGKLEKYFRNYSKGEIIFVKGDVRKGIYYLLEGEVEILIPAAGNTGTMVATRITSSFFGEMGHLLSENRTATARAITPVSVLEIPSGLFDNILAFDPDLDRAILKKLSQRLKKSNEQLNALTASRDT